MDSHKKVPQHGHMEQGDRDPQPWQMGHMEQALPNIPIVRELCVKGRIVPIS